MNIHLITGSPITAALLYHIVHYKIDIKYRNTLKDELKNDLGRDVLERSSCLLLQHPACLCVYPDLKTLMPERQLGLTLKRKNTNREARPLPDPGKLHVVDTPNNVR